MDPSSNQGHAPIFEDLSITAYVCINQDLMLARGSLAVCHAEMALQVNVQVKSTTKSAPLPSAY